MGTCCCKEDKGICAGPRFTFKSDCCMIGNTGSRSPRSPGTDNARQGRVQRSEQTSVVPSHPPANPITTPPASTSVIPSHPPANPITTPPASPDNGADQTAGPGADSVYRAVMSHGTYLPDGVHSPPIRVLYPDWHSEVIYPRTRLSADSTAHVAYTVR